ncbi:unnamed protein product [Euphydryas editha]|uniref:Transposable element P transposase-like RNase H domain-containing protein n=1 Tax=Euphydryas editha TaxID=104508 RepID=A0AAU9UNY6_EUPED|nr:unnamed protein product [Euphydryas editha]
MLPETSNKARKDNQRTPAAISSAAWRNYYEDKGQMKNEKQEAIRKSPLHRFPKPQYPHLERFNVWKFVLAKDIQNKGDIYIYNQIRICNRHFEECYRSQSHRVTANAVRTLNIGSSQLQPMETDVIGHVLTVMQPSTALTIKDDQAEDLCIFLSSSELHCMETDVVEHVLTVMQPSTSALITKDNNLAKQEKLSKSKSFLTVIEKMPDNIKTLTSLQLKWKTKARGRHYTLEEKIMALSIYKQGQKALKLMKTMFVLPSIRSLQKLLSGLTLKPGSKPEIMANLKTTVKKLSNEKRSVTLIFNEVSLSPGLFYNSSLCHITGFEDMGHERHKIIANHALVFMRVSSTMRFLAKHKILPAECEETADFLLIMAKLFDSFNGHSY